VNDAFPVSGSFSRTALNRYVGVTSGWSALFAALCTLLCLLFFTGYLQHLPRLHHLQGQLGLDKGVGADLALQIYLLIYLGHSNPFLEIDLSNVFV